MDAFRPALPDRLGEPVLHQGISVGRIRSFILFGSVVLSTLIALGQMPVSLAAGPPKTLDQVRTQARAARELLNRWTNGPTGTPGVWKELTGSGSGIGRWTHVGNEYTTTHTSIKENGELQTKVSLTRLDESRGTTVRYQDGNPLVVNRVIAEGNGVYRVEPLAELGHTEEEVAKNIYRISFVGDRYESLSPIGKKTAYQWVSAGDALANQNRIAEHQRSLEAQRVAAARAREAAQIEEDNRRWNETWDQIAEDNVVHQAEEAQADAEFEAEMAERRQTASAEKESRERDLQDSLDRLQATTDAAVAMQAEARRRAQQADADRSQAQADARAAQDAEAARQATQRQNEIAQRMEAEREAADTTRRQQATTGAPSPAAPARQACTQVHPKVSLGASTVRGEAVGISLVREKAAEFCRVRTGSAAFSGSPTCSANGPYVLSCSIQGECGGVASSTCGNSQ